MAEQGSVRAPPYYYRAYGLSITSDVALPELTPAETGGDLEIRFGTVDHLPPPPTAVGPGFSAVAGAIYYRYDRAGTFCVRAGREITIDPAPDAREELLRLYLTGPVLAVALHQRGLLILHGSMVDLDGNAAGFLGGQGWGKSTTAAMLHMRGHTLVTDDVMAVEAAREPPLVRPGFPQLKLWPDALTRLGRDPAPLPRLVAEIDKRADRLRGGFGVSAVPLRYLYVLAHGCAPAIEPLSAQESVIELVRHSYLAERLPVIGGYEENLLLCATLAAKTSVRRLRRPRALEQLEHIAALIERDISARATAAT